MTTKPKAKIAAPMPPSIDKFSVEDCLSDLAKLISVDAMDPDTPLDQKIDAFKVLLAYHDKAHKRQPAAEGSAFDAYRRQPS